jgi:hypothetical protein
VHRAFSSGAVGAVIEYNDGAWIMTTFPSRDAAQKWAGDHDMTYQLTPEMESYFIQLQDLAEGNRRAVEGQ